MADSLLSEVDADLRAERIHQLWLRYRRPLFIAIAAVMLATIAFTLWERYEQKRGGEWMQQFIAAQTLYQSQQFDEAATAFGAVASHTRGQLSSLAELWQARSLAAADKKPEAIALLKQTSARGNGLWSDLACLRLVSLDAKAADCLARKGDSPLAGERREWLAASLWAQGNEQEATALLEQLATSPDTSEPSRARVIAWLSTIRAQKAE